jgi:hypothetical protein
VVSELTRPELKATWKPGEHESIRPRPPGRELREVHGAFRGHFPSGDAILRAAAAPRRTHFLAAESPVAAVSCSPTRDMFSTSDRDRITKRGFVVASVHGRAGISGDSKGVPAPAKIRPAACVDLAVLDRFLAGNKSCGQLMVRTRGKDVKRIRFWDPLVPGGCFAVGTGPEITASNERRQLLQAEPVRASANSRH